jgi:hypothetical protein
MTVLFHESVQANLVPIETVSQHPQNPNNGDVEVVADSILAHGFYNPVVVQKSTGRIVAGNTRYAALLSLGETQIPVVSVDISDEQALRILIVDNRTSELGVRDGHELAALLRQLDASDEGLMGTGYTPDDYTELRRLNHISEGSGFGLNQAIDYGDAVTPYIIIGGHLDENDHVEVFDADEADAQVVQLRELGYNARRGDHLG